MATSGSLRNSQKSIGTIWDLEWKLTAVVHGDSYKVVDREKRRNLLVWVSRTSLEKDQQKAFLRHVSRLIPFSTLPAISHGIDDLGFGYVALQIEGCAAVDSNKPTVLEIRYRFIQCVAKVASFHQRNIALENISPGAFVLDGDQEVVFIGLLGGFVVRDMEAVPLDVRACLPLSSLANLLSGAKADVYALAVLGLRLFGAQFPPSGINPEEVDQYLERIPDSAPRWVSHVLGPIVKQPQRSALRDAADLLAALAEHERRYPPGELQSTPSRKRGETRGLREKRVALELLLSVQEIALRSRLRDKSRKQPFLGRMVRSRASQLLTFCLLVGVAINAGLIPFSWFGRMWPWPSELVTSTPSDRLNAIERAQENFDRGGLSFSDIVVNLERLSADQPQAELWKAACNRLKEKGYHNTAIMAAAAVSEGGGLVREPAVLARVLSPEISTQHRIEQLRSYETIAPELAGRVGAALALDDKAALEEYRDVLISSTRKLITDAANDQVSERTTPALIAALAGKSELSDARNRDLLNQMSPVDLWWLVNFHVERRSDTLPLVLDSVLSRGACEGSCAVFLELARQAAIGPDTPYEALIHSAQSGSTLEDVTLFSEWLAPQSEQALYAVLMTSSDQSIVTAALDSLRTKPQLDGLVVDIADIVRSRGDGEILQYSFLVGVLGLRSSLDQAAVARGLQSVKDKPLTNQIVQKIFERGDPKTIATTLPLYGNLIHPSFLIPLLKHPDPEIRLSTVPFVKDLPLASSRAELQRLYVAEEDPRVREAYEREGVAAR